MITWDFAHVLREYMVCPRILRGGQVIEVPAGSGPQSFRFTAHALRGMAATIGVTVGDLPHKVAQSLRHGEQISRNHYIRPEALAAAHRNRLGDLLRPGVDKQLETMMSRWEAAGWTVPAAELKALLLGQAASTPPNGSDESGGEGREGGP